MKVINDLLEYKNYKIVQDDEYFNFSLDSVLLPNFVTLNSNIKSILDIGTGNAPIPMILTTLVDKEVEICGFEIQKDIYDLAKESVEINNLSERIRLINDDVKNIDKYFPINKFDVILSNPPYFKMNESSNINEDIHKTIARHEKYLNLDELTHIASTYLKNNGIFAIVHRTDRLIDIIETMRKYNIEPKRLELIYPKVGKESNMILIEGRKNGNPGLKILQPLIVHNDDGSYTDIIKDMFKSR